MSSDKGSSVSEFKFNIRQIEKEVMQHIILPVSYRLARGTVDDRLVVLADCHHNSCPEELKLLKQRLKQEGFDVRCVFFDIGKLAATKTLKSMLGFMKLYKKAGTVIVCSYFLPVASCKKKKKTKVINVWHGCGAMKKFGYDAADDIPRDYIGNPFKNTDLMCVSGTKCVEPFSSAICCKTAEVLPVGISVTDTFFNEAYKAKVKKKFGVMYPDAIGKKVVLWAPTFRKNAAKASYVGEEYIDELAADDKLNEEYFFIKSVHPNSVKHKKAEALSTRQLMMCCDVLVTDYSSVWFEYLLLDKPIIYFAPDYSEYMRDRGMYLAYDELPGVVIKDEKSSEALKKTLTEHMYAEDKYNLKRHKCREEYMNGCDGFATDKLIEKIGER